MAMIAPARATLCMGNRFVEGMALIQAYTSQQPAFPATRLLDPKRSRDWRTTSLGVESVIFRLTTPYLPQVVGMIASNMIDGMVVLSGASDAAMTTNLAQWALTIGVTQNSFRQMYAWYLGAADVGVGAARTFWKFELNKAGGPAAPCWSVGAFWGSDYLEFPFDLGMSRDTIDSTRVSTGSDADAEFFEPGKTKDTIDFTQSAVPSSDSRVFKELVETYGIGSLSVLDTFAPKCLDGDSNIRRERLAALYYGRLGNRDKLLTTKRVLQNRDTLNWAFNESRA